MATVTGTSPANAPAVERVSWRRHDYDVRPLTREHLDWAKAIFAHSFVFGSPIFRFLYTRGDRMARFHAMYRACHLMMRELIDSGLSLGVFLPEYRYEWPESSAATGGRVYIDEYFGSSDNKDDRFGHITDEDDLLLLMDNPLVSIACACDAAKPVDQRFLAPVQGLLPATVDFFKVLNDNDLVANRARARARVRDDDNVEWPSSSPSSSSSSTTLTPPSSSGSSSRSRGGIDSSRYHDIETETVEEEEEKKRAMLRTVRYEPTAPGQIMQRMGTATHASYSRLGLMPALARYQMRWAYERGFGEIHIDCFHDSVARAWADPPHPFKAYVAVGVNTWDIQRSMLDSDAEQEREPEPEPGQEQEPGQNELEPEQQEEQEGEQEEEQEEEQGYWCFHRCLGGPCNGRRCDCDGCFGCDGNGCDCGCCQDWSCEYDYYNEEFEQESEQEQESQQNVPKRSCRHYCLNRPCDGRFCNCPGCTGCQGWGCDCGCCEEWYDGTWGHEFLVPEDCGSAVIDLFRWDAKKGHYVETWVDNVNNANDDDDDDRDRDMHDEEGYEEEDDGREDYRRWWYDGMEYEDLAEALYGQLEAERDDPGYLDMVVDMETEDVEEEEQEEAEEAEEEEKEEEGEEGDKSEDEKDDDEDDDQGDDERNQEQYGYDQGDDQSDGKHTTEDEPPDDDDKNHDSGEPPPTPSSSGSYHPSRRLPEKEKVQSDEEWEEERKNYPFRPLREEISRIYVVLR